MRSIHLHHGHHAAEIKQYFERQEGELLRGLNEEGRG